ncbi:uncharacterized protein LOC119591781 [Penaeus monodon]|uniref:uncharacterized protein LOC119591781 n=1 Tax=Penaeus monodon TaxID=6687 RepID=UPI0018A778EA|nr:uncharacterized protein LOC119591781 [Penaeus monodon]
MGVHSWVVGVKPPRCKRLYPKSQLHIQVWIQYTFHTNSRIQTPPQEHFIYWKAQNTENYKPLTSLASITTNTTQYVLSDECQELPRGIGRLPLEGSRKQLFNASLYDYSFPTQNKIKTRSADVVYIDVGHGRGNCLNKVCWYTVLRITYVGQQETMESGRRKAHPSGGKGLSEECGVSVGDRVVWLTEEYPELGWVRWTGKQPGLDGSPGWMVGVEFDHPVGNDNHRVNGRQLFDAKMNHASLLPVTSLMKAEDFLGSEALNVEHHSGRNSSGKRPAHLTSKGDNQLGSDISSMTPFHLLAYEQLSASGQRNSDPPPPYSEKEDWEILPHMTYSVQKNMLSSNKETLHDHKSRQRDKGKILNRNLDKKNNKWKSPGTGTRSTNVNADVDQNSPIGGFGDNDFPVNPLYHLSLHGISLAMLAQQNKCYLTCLLGTCLFTPYTVQISKSKEHTTFKRIQKAEDLMATFKTLNKIQLKDIHA